MKRTLITFIAALCLSAGCGNSSSLSNGSDAISISAMEIAVSPKSVRVGIPAQLSLTVTFDSGEQLSGLTTSFEDPNTSETVPIEWSSSNKAVADIGEGALMVPASPGSVMINVNVMGKSQSKSVRIFDAYSPIVPDPDVSVPEEETELPAGEEPPAASAATCRGHAVSVTLFSPGAGAGFGASSMPSVVLGPPYGAGAAAGSSDVVSLGRLGEIVLHLGDCALVDGPGVDLIVFENAFFIGGDTENPYAELGIVGVSEDGVDFMEFSCEAAGFPYTGCAGWNPVYSSPLNGISSYDVANAGGDHFDLADIGVGVAHYVRIRDAGTEGFGTSVGFDLDAISVVNGIVEMK